MSRSPHRTARLAEGAVLGGALLASLALLAVSLLLGDAPERLGRSALDEFAGRMRERALALWQRTLEEPASGAEPWSAPSELVPAALPAPLRAPSSSLPTSLAFDALLQQARRELRARDPEGRATLEAALELPVDDVRRSQALALAVREARARGDGEAARAAWRELLTRAGGAEVDEDGDPLLLLAGLAVAPLLDGAERGELGRTLVERWTRGEVALGHPALELEPRGQGVPRVRIAPELLLLRDAFASSLLEEDLDARALVLLEAELAAGPRPVERGVDVTLADGRLLLRRVEGERIEAWTDSLERVEQRFLAEWAAQEDVVDAVLLAPDSDPPSSQGAVLASAELPGIARALHLVHPDPEAFLRESTRALRTLRAGLVVLAVLVLAGGAASVLALRRARRLQELKEVFVANVSHELRTPVTGLRLTAESLAEGRARTPERRERYHGILLREALRLERLVNDVLDFSRLERGQGPRLHRRPTDVAAFARELADEAEREVRAAGLAFEAELGPFEGATAMLDAEALRRAVLNLVRNGCLHSGSDLLRLEIGAEGGLVVRVLDRGRGLPPRSERRLFEPFQQAPRDGEKPAGTGLGLAIAREIARAHEGSLRVGPGLEGRGAGFVLRVPAQEVSRG